MYTNRIKQRLAIDASVNINPFWAYFLLVAKFLVTKIQKILQNTYNNIEHAKQTVWNLYRKPNCGITHRLGRSHRGGATSFWAYNHGIINLRPTKKMYVLRDKVEFLAKNVASSSSLPFEQYMQKQWTIMIPRWFWCYLFLMARTQTCPGRWIIPLTATEIFWYFGNYRIRQKLSFIFPLWRPFWLLYECGGR